MFGVISGYGMITIFPAARQPGPPAPRRPRRKTPAGHRPAGVVGCHDGVAMSLDDIDARIVTALIKDARASYAVIGNEVGLSAPAVKRRVDRLRASGAITGFSARVDPAAL